jgi:serine/threonine-protein kinase HipA
MVSNVDDHLRNHGFLWVDRTGWSLSPAYDLNPVPTDLKARILTTNINLDEGTCSIDLLEEAGELSSDTKLDQKRPLASVAHSEQVGELLEGLCLGGFDALAAGEVDPVQVGLA